MGRDSLIYIAVIIVQSNGCVLWLSRQNRKLLSTKVILAKAEQMTAVRLKSTNVDNNIIKPYYTVVV